MGLGLKALWVRGFRAVWGFTKLGVPSYSILGFILGCPIGLYGDIYEYLGVGENQMENRLENQMEAGVVYPEP